MGIRRRRVHSLFFVKHLLRYGTESRALFVSVASADGGGCKFVTDDDFEVGVCSNCWEWDVVLENEAGVLEYFFFFASETFPFTFML